MYRNLDALRILETIRRLRDRVQERFPGSSLGQVAEEFLQLSEKTAARAEWIRRPNVLMRTGIALLVLLFLGIMTGILIELRLSPKVDRFSEFMQAIDASLNTILLIGGGILFLFTLDARWKRRRALTYLHELRSLAHIVDMHQLTKDPERLLRGLPLTVSSPVRTMTGGELVRYLDYCGEMLSLIGKVAALYVQEYNDPVVLSGVDQIEDLTTGLSRKLWQKIMIIDRSQP